MAREEALGLALPEEKERVWWRSVPRGIWWFTRRKPLGAFSAFVILVMVVCATFADTQMVNLPFKAITWVFSGGQLSTGVVADKPLLAPYHFDAQDISGEGRLQNPTWTHPFGTDQLGRDMLSRVIYGTRTSVLVGLTTVIVASLIATVVGVVSGYFGRWFDTILQRLVDIWIAFPALVLLITFVEIAKAQIGDPVTGVVDPKMEAIALAVALGVLLGGGASRVIRGATVALKNNVYVEAARALGATDARIILRHILPNVAPVVIVLATLQLGIAILAESTVSFLGFGVRPPLPSWGQMLGGQGLLFFRVDPWLAIFPGLAIVLVVYAFNMLGDSLRDVADPRLRGSGVGPTRGSGMAARAGGV